MYELLSGLRIVECPAFVAAPLCGNALAQLGAEVIRIDPLQGGLDYGRWPINQETGRSLYWAGLNNAKKSVAIDLRSDEGRALVRALIAAPGKDGGIFTTNLSPDWASYETLRTARSDLIMLAIEGNPGGGTALDYTVNSLTGIPYVTGAEGESGPVNHSMPAWDIGCALHGALAILAAERRRSQTGEGAFIKLALSDIAFASIAALGYSSEVEVNGKGRPAVGNHIYGTFGRDFLSKDGKRVMLVAITPRQWSGLGKATGLTEIFAAEAKARGLDFAKEGDRYAGREIIAAKIEEWCRVRDYAAIKQAFDANGILWGPYQSTDDAVRSDARFKGGNEVFETVAHPGVGTFTLPGVVSRFQGLERKPVPEAPQLGRDTRAVLSDVLGMGDKELDGLSQRGIIAPAN